jgi:DNA polymerase V
MRRTGVDGEGSLVMKVDMKYLRSTVTVLNDDEVRGAPLAGSMVAAGFPSPADDYVERHLDLNEYLIQNPAATFFVRVSGESMIEAGIHDKDLLVVDRSIDPEPGHVVIAVLDGEMVVKRLRLLGKRLFLMPENSAFPPLEIHEEMEFTVWGVVTYVVHAVE